MSFSVKKTGGRMWHEARKQEKKIRGMLVDYRRRAERRRDYYEKIVRTESEGVRDGSLPSCSLERSDAPRVIFTENYFHASPFASRLTFIIVPFLLFFFFYI